MNPYDNDALIKAASNLLKKPIHSVQMMAQGDLSRTMRVTLENNTSYIIKNGPDPLTEGNMLRTFTDHDIPAPHVIAADKQILIIECLDEKGSFSKETWKQLGIILTKMHCVHGPQYGWEKNYAFGKVTIINDYKNDWVDFWGQNRLACFLKHVPIDIANPLEKLIKSLGNYIPNHPSASLLHGDLWTGNLLISKDQPYLIDPACYYGHGEVDIAMLNVFGSPDSTFYQNYDLLEKGWQERMPIYQLFPALVHYRLFGGQYLSMVSGLLQKIGI